MVQDLTVPTFWGIWNTQENLCSVKEATTRENKTNNKTYSQSFLCSSRRLFEAVHLSYVTDHY